MLKRLGSVVLAVAALTVTAPAHAEPSPIYRGVHVIGDSITNRAQNTVLSEANRPDGWTLDGFPGRRLTALTAPYIPATVDKASAIRHGFRLPRAHISTAVLALGTNGADDVLTVSEAAAIYAQGVRAIRSRNVWTRGAPKKVILVTPWRNPGIEEGVIDPSSGLPFWPYQWASKGVVYTEAIERVAANSGGVCVMRWDVYAAAHPARFPDGTHPDEIGMTAWRSLLYHAIRTC